MPENLAALTASQLRDVYASGEASPVDATRAVLDQIEAHNPILNCFCLVDADAALGSARDAETRWTKGEPLSAIDGVPVSIKDLTPTKGWPTLRGSRTSDPDAPRDEDAPAAARLREAGAVLTGKTTTPEFGWKGVTDNPLTGITRNPWNPERTPGGSSGGASSACAAFMGPLHQGSDAAGSIRIPSAFAGIFGHKPTFGLVPNYPLPGHIGNLANMGPMTRTVTDAALMLNILASPDSRDSMSAPASAQDENYLNGLDAGIEGVRIAYSPTLGNNGWVNDDVAAAVADAAKTLSDIGAVVEEIDPDIPPTRPIIEVIWAAADAWLVDQIPADKHHLMDPGLLAIAEEGRKLSATDLVNAHAARVELGNKMAQFHENYDLLLTPQMPLEAIEAGKNVPNESDMTHWVDWCPFTYPFNLTMQPACSVPCGLGDEHLPVAFQLVGRHWEDALVLRAARAFEKSNPFAAAPGYL
ncbi:MAG: amidase [Alphaproteobacteria bacterium]|nr:amidase [Alphaproteobacteria bacterium]HCP01711.1 amidase [Rhodospirillaceae bacterium]